MSDIYDFENKPPVPEQWIVDSFYIVKPEISSEAKKERKKSNSRSIYTKISLTAWIIIYGGGLGLYLWQISTMEKVPLISNKTTINKEIPLYVKEMPVTANIPKDIAYNLYTEQVDFPVFTVLLKPGKNIITINSELITKESIITCTALDNIQFKITKEEQKLIIGTNQLDKASKLVCMITEKDYE